MERTISSLILSFDQALFPLPFVFSFPLHHSLWLSFYFFVSSFLHLSCLANEKVPAVYHACHRPTYLSCTVVTLLTYEIPFHSLHSGMFYHADTTIQQHIHLSPLLFPLKHKSFQLSLLQLTLQQCTNSCLNTHKDLTNITSTLHAKRRVHLKPVDFLPLNIFTFPAEKLKAFLYLQYFMKPIFLDYSWPQISQNLISSWATNFLCQCTSGSTSLSLPGLNQTLLFLYEVTSCTSHLLKTRKS